STSYPRASPSMRERDTRSRSARRSSWGSSSCAGLGCVWRNAAGCWGTRCSAASWSAERELEPAGRLAGLLELDVRKRLHRLGQVDAGLVLDRQDEGAALELKRLHLLDAGAALYSTLQLERPGEAWRPGDRDLRALRLRGRR